MQRLHSLFSCLSVLLTVEPPRGSLCVDVSTTGWRTKCLSVLLTVEPPRGSLCVDVSTTEWRTKCLSVLLTVEPPRGSFFCRFCYNLVTKVNFFVFFSFFQKIVRKFASENKIVTILFSKNSSLSLVVPGVLPFFTKVNAYYYTSNNC